MSDSRNRPPRHPCEPISLVASLAACVAALGSLPATAQDATESVYLNELPVVLTAARLQQALRDAPGALTVLDREMIAASGARDLPDLLRLIPGFQVGQLASHLPLAGYHGITDSVPRRMLVLVDGRSTYSPYFLSGVEWEQIPLALEDIERIEVFRGSNSVSYGANAFLGVVNIFSRHPADSSPLRVKVTEGNHGIADRGASVAYQSPDLALRLSLTRRQDDGIPGVFDDRRSDHADFRADFPLGPQDRLEVFAGLSASRVGTGQYGPDTTDPIRQRRIDLSFGQLRWHHEIAPGNQFQLSLLHQEESGEDSFVLRNPGLLAGLPFAVQVPISYDNSVIRDEIELEHTLPGGRDLRFNWGLSYRMDRLRTNQLFGAQSPVLSRYGRVFGNAEWRASPDWLFNLGASLEDPNYAESRIAPRASANYHMTESQTIRFAAGQAYRFPTPFEKQADMRFYAESPSITPPGLVAQTFGPAANLQAEKVSFQELGYLAELPAWRSSADLRLFREKISSMISDTNSTGTLYLQIPLLSPTPIPIPSETSHFRNGRGPTIQGFETLLTYRPGPRSWVQLGHATIRIEADDSDPNGARKENSAPQNSTFLFSSWDMGKGWQLSGAHYRVGSFGWMSSPGGRVSGYHRTDARLAYRFLTPIGRGLFTVTGQSLGGDYADYHPDQSMDRRVFASISLEL